MKTRFWLVYFFVVFPLIGGIYFATAERSNVPLALSDFSSEEDSLDLDIEKILSGIQYYDSLIKSGEGDVTYKHIYTVILGGTKIPKGKMPEMRDETYTYHLTFYQGKTRMDIPEHVGNMHSSKLTVVNDEKGEWTVVYHGGKISRYTYSTKHSISYIDRDPRKVVLKIPWRSKGTVYEYLKKKKFEIKQKEKVRKIECYRLETPDGKRRIWIAPDRGFRFLKYEYHYVSKNDSPIWEVRKKGTPALVRKLVFYQKYGEAWFPKQGIREAVFIDEKGQEHLVERQQYEIKNFRLNHDIPEEKFIIEIPGDAEIWVADLRETLSKKEFLKYYKP